MNSLRRLAKDWADAGYTLHALRSVTSQARGSSLQACALELSAELPKWERVIEAASELLERHTNCGIGHVADEESAKECSECAEIWLLKAALSEVRHD